MIRNSPDQGVVAFTVPGEPRPQPRTKARAFFNKRTGKYAAQVYNPKGDSADYRARVSHEAAIAMWGVAPLVGPLVANVEFILTKPKKPKHKNGPAVRPDWDNYAKACFDAMQSIVFVDDAQICRAVIEKRYSTDGEAPRTKVLCWRRED